jgi:RNA-directed DNA polymerase
MQGAMRNDFHCYRKAGSRHTGASPSKKSQQRVKQKVNDLLTPSQLRTCGEIRTRLNQKLNGWAYFSLWYSDAGVSGGR